MSLGLTHWKGRRKNVLRVRAHEVRALSPFLGVAFCALSSATFIFAAERLGLDEIESLTQTLQARAATPAEALEAVSVAYLTISSNSTSNASAAPALMRPVPRLP